MDSTTRLSGTPPFFSTGQQIVWRYGDVAAPHYALTLTVVRDDADSLVAWLRAGTPGLVSEDDPAGAAILRRRQPGWRATEQSGWFRASLPPYGSVAPVVATRRQA